MGNEAFYVCKIPGTRTIYGYVGESSAVWFTGRKLGDALPDLCAAVPTGNPQHLRTGEPPEHYLRPPPVLGAVQPFSESEMEMLYAGLGR